MFIEGIIVLLDLDSFEEYTVSHGFDEYKPNIVTGTLTQLIEEFITMYRGVVIYGLDKKRGTEEAIIELTGLTDREIADMINDLEKIKNRMNQLGVGITIVVLRDYVLLKPARNRREAYRATPGRRRAVKLLKSAKRKGGNTIVIKI